MKRIGGAEAESALRVSKQKQLLSDPLPKREPDKTRMVTLMPKATHGLPEASNPVLTGEVVDFVRRPDVAHGANAIECIRKNGESLGWLPRETASLYSTEMDHGRCLVGKVLYLESSARHGTTATARIIVGWTLTGTQLSPWREVAKPFRRELAEFNDREAADNDDANYRAEQSEGFDGFADDRYG